MSVAATVAPSCQKCGAAVDIHEDRRLPEGWFHADCVEPRPAGGTFRKAPTPEVSKLVEALRDPPTTVFRKDDARKARCDLLPPRALLEVAKVLADGAEKYAPGNWANVDDANRYVAAALRHIFGYMQGEPVDAETGRQTLCHAICCLLFVAELDLRKLPEPGRKGP